MTNKSEPKPPPSCGVLVVDKPKGCTSHDVVSWARRVFSTREIGHAGTLDPMATGVLVLLVGEATKLSNWVTSEDKRYDCELLFGVETDSLDADGAITRTIDADAPTREQIERACAAMVGVQMQVPPVVSAIKIDGVASHERVRRGESVELAPREVELQSVKVTAVSAHRAAISLAVSKGFYVRSFARDLAAQLGTVAHLTALRRTRSGVFSIEQAVDGEQLRSARAELSLREDVHRRLLPLRALEGQMPTIRVDAERALRVWQGKKVEAPETMGEGVHLVLVERGEHGLPTQPVGLVERVEGLLVVRRNLAPGRVLCEFAPWIDGALTSP